MATSAVEVLVDGGKASAAPPLGPALGPLGVNIGKVVSDINTKTAEFKGMQVPVKVTVDSDTKEYTITIGTPPVSALLKKEGKVEKGSGTPHTEFVADLKIEQIIKIAKMKQDSLSGKTLKERVKEVIGSARSLGIKIEEVSPGEAIGLVNEGKFDKEIAEEKTEISAEELAQIEKERIRMQKELEEKRAHYETMAKNILKENEGKPVEEARKLMEAAGIPLLIMNKIAPKPAAAGAGADKKGK